ncbi:MAG: long-chain-fatty-acid--CoA ligase [Deltaproteobacteria bacterium]|nr:long-chain-fatty-acid--CoA ligase [Deltaproteobacteria bacterium]MBW2414138.1 long-chain-fatty-acid--CoA ligase [Deltaproteobacteria bacterium]
MRLHDFLDYQARERGDAEFAIDERRALTYAQAQADANRLANALAASGLEVGDRIAVLAKNCVEYAVLYNAASKAGVVPVPLNYRLAPPEWEYIVKDAGAKLVIARGELVPALDTVRGGLPDVKQFVALDAEVPAGWQGWADWQKGQPDTEPGRVVGPDDDVYQMYTSGTTGRPKGAVLTHRALSFQLMQALTTMRSEPGARVLIVAPMYHAAAAVTVFNAATWGGSCFIQEDFNPVETVRALDEERIANATLVPAMIQACLLMVPDVKERRYENFEQLVYGASPISTETLRQALDTFRCRFVQGYGMTETTAALTYLMPEDHDRALAGEDGLLLSAGRPLLGTQIKIVDEQGETVPNGTVGEICGRGPQLMKGYWNLPEATSEALVDGWMHTGDAGYVDDEGFVYVQDRTKDMIVSGGENVYPREVEDAIFEHAAVADVAVIGIPSERWGEEVKAIVVLKQGAEATGEDIVAHCKTRLGSYKQPRSVDFIGELPRNPSGKVLKKELREPYWKGHDRRVS